MIDHHHRVIFVHIPKCAGQSIESWFLQQIGIAWHNRHRFMMMEKPYGADGPMRLAHLTAEEYVEHGYVPASMFQQYFSFAFVRNPFARAVSFYRFLGFDQRCTFRRFCERAYSGSYLRRHSWFLRPQAEFIFDEEGRQLVDFLGRFESLEDDFREVQRRLGLPQTALPRKNVTNDMGSDSVSRVSLPALRRALHEMRRRQFPVYPGYRDYFDAGSRRMISDYYARDIELLGYDF